MNINEMLIEITTLSKADIAFGAFVGALTGVLPQMVGDVKVLVECLVAALPVASKRDAKPIALSS